ncbi:MAG: AAA family ATPase [Streptosporangiaceae bacterium]
MTASATALDLTTRAAVLVNFELASFAAGSDVTAVLAFLQERCQRTVTPSGQVVWSLTDRERRRCLARVPLTDLRAARDGAATVPQTPVQAALDQSLAGGWTVRDLEDLTPEQARALSVVAAWWDGHHSAVPDLRQATLLADRLNLFADIRSMAADHFVGRSDILGELRQHFNQPGSRAFAVHGLGGIGKSALVARHVTWAIDALGGPGAYAVVLDFDDPTLNPAYPLDIVNRIVNLVSRQVGGPERPRLDRLAKVALDAAETANFRQQSSSKAASRTPGAEIPQLVSDLTALVSRPILVVFDTAEQVQRRGQSAVGSFSALVGQLASTRTPVRVVVCGRAEVPGLAASVHELLGLGQAEAVTLLTELCTRPVDARTAAAVIDALGTSPLTIRLAARLLSDPDTVPGDLLALDLHAKRIDAELYRRVLRHIRDPEIQRLAHPGLVLRRITPDIIEHVLARPCQVAVPDVGTARDLFRRLAQEAMLVDRSPDGESLVHRADVRRVMLPQLQTDRRDVARRIQRSAIRYYSARTDLTSRTEELYHRLMLEQKPATLARHWDPRAAEALIGALDEFPACSRIYLTRQLPETYLSEDDRRLVGQAQWLDEARPHVERLLAAGEARQALQLLAERRGADGTSLLPALEIEALEALGDLNGAIAIARDNRRTASIANDPAEVTTYTLHLARLLERDDQLAAASTALREALTRIREPATDRLRLLVALLGLWRRQGHPAGTRDYEAYQAEAVQLYNALGDRQIRGVPGLLRDLAAEVSPAHPAILDDALGTIGVDASPGGPLPGALRELDQSLAAEHGTPGLVADLAQLDRSGGGVAWQEIASKPRGETGQAVLEVLKTFGSSADPLRSAVAADYQQEADAALLGFEFNVAHKA